MVTILRLSTTKIIQGASKKLDTMIETKIVSRLNQPKSVVNKLISERFSAEKCLWNQKFAIFAIDMKQISVQFESWLEWPTWNLNLKIYLIHIQECNWDLKQDLGNFSHRVHRGHCSHLSPSERPMYGRWSGPARPAHHGRAHPCPGDNHCRFHWIGHVWFC